MSIIKIPINDCGLEAIIDEEDLPLVSRFRWHRHQNVANPYAATRAYMHRLIVPCPPGMVIDHINGNSLDNRKENLRVCTQFENLQNRRKEGRVGRYKGVYRNGNRWAAKFIHNGKRTFIGNFETELEAAVAHNEAIREIVGDLAYLSDLEAA